MNPQQLNDLLRPMTLRELRVQCRARGVNPGGGHEALTERLRENMLTTGNFNLVIDGEEKPLEEAPQVKAAAAMGNNYSRPDGQNVGNFLTEKSSSRVIQPPGGASQICFGSDDEYASPVKSKFAGSPLASPVGSKFAGPGSPLAGSASTEPVDTESPRIAAARSNNYHRPAGQNVGNFMTDRSSSRVTAPPGGRSSIMFG